MSGLFGKLRSVIGPQASSDSNQSLEQSPSNMTGGTPNKTLKGHTLIVLTEFDPVDYLISDLQSTFSDLRIINRHVSWHSTTGLDDIPEADWQSATALLTGSTIPKPEEVKHLKLVQLTSAGANHVLKTPLFKDTDVAFCTANGVHGPQISEWVIATYLANQHNIPRYLDFQREKRWEKVKGDPDDSVGQRVGILGYGSIGRQVARVCTAMGMSVHAYTLHPRDTPESRRDHSYSPPGLGDVEGVLPRKWFSGGSKEDLHAFLGSDLDLLVVALPLTEKTTKLISTAEFQVLGKKRTFLSNIGRGPIVDPEALYEALQNDVIRGAALDVTDPEPLPDGDKLWGAKNIIITPHVSGRSTSYKDRSFAILKANLESLAYGKDFMNRVNRKDGY